jgi:hypothetical protein
MNQGKFNFIKVKNTIRLIKIILIENLSLHCEKKIIFISIVYIAKTSISGYRLNR